MKDVTQILSAIEEGDPTAPEELLPLVYDELRKLAAVRMVQERPGQTLQATALVHEAYMRLVGGGGSNQWDSRGHFFAAAAEAMRRILVDVARKKQSQRRGGRHFTLSDDDAVSAPIDDQLLDLDQAISKLGKIDQQAAEVVKFRIFAGMTIEEVAAYQKVSPSTVKRSWAYARAWLGRELEDCGGT